MRGSSTLAPGQVGRRRRHVEPLHPARHRRLRERELAGEAVVDVRLAVLRQPKRNRCVALRVEVGEQGRVAGVGDAGAEVDGGGRLTHPALLVGDAGTLPIAGESTNWPGRNHPFDDSRANPSRDGSGPLVYTGRGGSSPSLLCSPSQRAPAVAATRMSSAATASGGDFVVVVRPDGPAAGAAQHDSVRQVRPGCPEAGMQQARRVRRRPLAPTRPRRGVPRSSAARQWRRCAARDRTSGRFTLPTHARSSAGSATAPCWRPPRRGSRHPSGEPPAEPLRVGPAFSNTWR